VTYRYDDDEDRAIARALDEPVNGDDMDIADDDTMTDEYRTALSHLPFEEIAPPPDLEERVMAAALERRSSQTVSLERARHRRRTRVRWAALGAVAVAAAAIVAVLLVDTSSTQQPSGSIETVAVQRADLDAALANPATRSGAFTGDPARGFVALTPDGDGFLYDYAANAPAGRTAWLWLVTSDGDKVRVGRLPNPPNGEVEFNVDGDVDAVRAVALSIEPDDITPEQPSDSNATASLD
jgi:anti-sigma-K factor RskA